jgi:Domain of unknown function (DUF4604)
MVAETVGDGYMKTGEDTTTEKTAYDLSKDTVKPESLDDQRPSTMKREIDKSVKLGGRTKRKAVRVVGSEDDDAAESLFSSKSDQIESLEEPAKKQQKKKKKKIALSFGDEADV